MIVAVAEPEEGHCTPNLLARTTSLCRCVGLRGGQGQSDVVENFAEELQVLPLALQLPIDSP